MFQREDEYVAPSVHELKTHSLYGGIGYTWEGDQDSTTQDFDELDMEWIMDLLRTAIEWKLMFGMCPYYEMKTGDGRPSITVPEVGGGQFMARNGANRKTEVGWLSKEGAQRGSMEPDTLVYVWPDQVPDIGNWWAPYRSVGARLLKTFLEKEELRLNALVADHLAARPPLIMQHALRPPGIDQQSETQIFADVLARGSDVQSVDDEQMYRVNRESRARGLVHQDGMNGTTGFGTAPGIGAAGQFVNQVRLLNYQQYMPPLPVGQVPARYQMPQPRTDILSWFARWQSIVAKELGVPAESAARAADPRTQTLRTQYSPAEASRLEDSVRAVRTDLARFFEFAFRTLRSVDQDTSLTEEIHLLRKEGTNLAKLKDRFQDHFYGRTNGEIAASDPKAKAKSSARSRREGVLRSRLATELSMGRAQVDVLDSDALDVLLGRKKQDLNSRLSQMTKMIESRTRLHLVWKEALVLNWDFVFQAHERGLLPDDVVRRMVCAKFGLPYNDCAAEKGEPASKKRKTQHRRGTVMEEDKGGNTATTVTNEKAKKE